MRTLPRRTANIMEAIKQKSFYGLAATIGFILSPASWWNDAFVNIPLALLSAKLLTLLGVPMDIGFVASYWASNVLGIILMAYGVTGLVARRITRVELVKWLAVSTFYTIAMLYIISVFNL